MFAAVRGTRIYFDVEGMGLVPDGAVMRERPAAMLIHGGPGSDHSGFKPSFSPLAARMRSAHHTVAWWQWRMPLAIPTRYRI